MIYPGKEEENSEIRHMNGSKEQEQANAKFNNKDPQQLCAR